MFYEPFSTAYYNYSGNCVFVLILYVNIKKKILKIKDIVIFVWG